MADDHSQRLARHDAKFEHHHDRITDLEHTVYGNAKDGLKTIVDRLEQRAAGHPTIVVAICTLLAAIVSGLFHLFGK